MTLIRLSVLFSIFLFFTNNIRSQSYFQQEVNYTISVELDTLSQSLLAHERIVYSNNSPDTLHFIWFHVWPNAYKNRHTAFAKQQLEMGKSTFHFDTKKRGYMDSLHFTTHGEPLMVEPHDKCIDIIKVWLSKPLLPLDTVEIETPFFVKLPETLSRMGYSGNTYQISQWYPKPAVYDTNGWHEMPYLDKGEFYSEFGSFNVSISVPSNYVLAASGSLNNSLELAWLDSLSVLGYTSADFPNPCNYNFKTLNYTLENSHDFAWFTSPDYKVSVDSVTLKKSGKVVRTQTLFLPKNEKRWANANTYINDALEKYSGWYMDYPWDCCTAVDGALGAGGAMEYPTITVVGSTSNKYVLETMIMHEVGHNWFYGILGFNERDYPFLDEGLNSFSENRYMAEKYPDLKFKETANIGDAVSTLLGIQDLSYKSYYTLLYLIQARENKDQAANLKSVAYTTMNYGAVVYMKNAASFMLLKTQLGEERFNAIMQAYFSTWAFKHPSPDSFKEFVEARCDENLDWLFRDLLGSTKISDYGIGSLKGGRLIVKNRGEVLSPLQYSCFANGEFLASCTHNGFMGKQTFLMPEFTDSVVLFNGLISPDYRLNNNIQCRGFSRRFRPSFLPVTEQAGYRQIGVMPLLAFNVYNGIMSGLSLSSPLFPTQNFEYELNPMFGFKNTDIAGTGTLKYNIFPRNSSLRKIELGLRGKRFGTDLDYSYNKASLFGNLHFKQEQVLNSTNHTLYFELSHQNKLETILNNDHKSEYHQLYQIGFASSDNKALSKWDIDLNFTGSESVGVTSVNAKYQVQLLPSIKFKSRLYFASVLYAKDDVNEAYLPHVSGMNGLNDPLFDAYYFSRFSTGNSPLINRQFSRNQGGFVSYLPYAFTDKSLLAVNMELKVKPLPFWFYVNIATLNSVTGVNRTSVYDDAFQDVFAEVGLSIPLGPLTIYVPMFLNTPGWSLSSDAKCSIRYTFSIESIVNIRHTVKSQF